MKNIVDRADKKQHVLFPFIGLFIVIALVLTACGDLTLGVNLRSRAKTSVPEQPKREARSRQTC